jgi:hypothetical protein
MFLQPTSAYAAVGFANITCENPDTGEQVTLSTGWDNLNEYFADKGDIARHFCEGGWAGYYTTYIGDDLPANDPQRYYAGIVPEPSPTPTAEPEPILEPTPTPSESLTPEPTPTPSQSELPTPEPQLTAEPIPEPVIEPEIIELPTLEPEPLLELVPEITLEAIEPETLPEPIEPPLEITIEPTQEELVEAVTDLYPDLMEGLSVVEAVALAELLTEFTVEEAITFEAFEESGLDYEDLPPEQPIMLENGVILEAQVADAIEIFDTVDELLATIFADPGKAIMAAANIGADMTPIEREENQSVVVGAIVVANIATSVRRIK